MVDSTESRRFANFAYRPEFQMTREHDVSETGADTDEDKVRKLSDSEKGDEFKRRSFQLSAHTSGY
jgi:hypothetical protein